MDGINPTLAFAALFFGLAGHPHNAAEQPLKQTYTEQGPAAGPQVADLSPCMDFAAMGEVNDVVPETFGRDATGTSIFLNKFGESTLTVARNPSYPTAFDSPDALDSFFATDGGLSELDTALETDALQGVRIEEASELRDANGCGYLPPEP